MSDYHAHTELLTRADRRAAMTELADFARAEARRHEARAQRRTNRRLLFVAAVVGVLAFGVGYMSAPRAAELHVVAHGISVHSRDRVETRTESVPPKVYWHGKRALQGPSTREVQVAVPHEERNWGAGLRADLSPALSLQAGAYRNSYRRTSVYALADWTPLRAGPLHLGAFAGVASGYDHGGAAGGLVLRLQGERASLVLRAIPKVHAKQTGHAAALELGWRL